MTARLSREDVARKYGRQLLPCPFCGKDPRLNVYEGYAEVSCECETEVKVRAPVARAVIRIWNTRSGRHASSFAKEKVHRFLEELKVTEGINSKALRHLIDYIEFHEGKNISSIQRSE